MMAEQCLNNMENDIRKLTTQALADEYGFDYEEATELLNNKIKIDTDNYNKFYNTEMAMTKEEHEQYCGENLNNNDNDNDNDNDNNISLTHELASVDNSKHQPESTKEPELQKLRLILNRKFIQGGLSNEEYDEHNLHDWRLQHHIVTDYFKKWQNYDKQGDDSKFTDCKSIIEPNKKAEGKPIRKEGVNFTPSVNVGGGRKFNEDNLKNCFKINSHYYLYDRGVITDTTIEFIIYMVPIEIIKMWYNTCGNGKGKISKKKILNCINEVKFNEIIWKRL